MENLVTYILNLEDRLSGGITHAKGETDKLHESMHHVRETILEVGKALGVAFGIEKMIEFGKESYEVYEKVHKAETSLSNTMQNMGTYSKESFEQLTEGAKELHKHTGIATSELMGLQSRLSLVSGLGVEQINKIAQAATDMAVKTGKSAEEMGTVMTKAFTDPEMARRLTSQIGIPKEAIERLKQLSESGHKATAQMELLEMIESKVGGAAAAAFNADPMNQMSLAMGDLHKTIGKVEAQVMKKLAPAFLSVIETVKEMVTWMREHKTLMLAMVDVVAALTVVTLVQTVATWDLAAALAATGISEVVIGVTALIAGIALAYQKFDGFRHLMDSVGETVKALAVWIAEYLGGALKMLWGVLTVDTDMIKNGWNDFSNAGENAIDSIDKAWDGHEARNEERSKKEYARVKKSLEDMADLYNQHKMSENALMNVRRSATKTIGEDLKSGMLSEQEKNELLGLIPKSRTSAGKNIIDKTTTEKKEKAEGQKNINIHVVYNAPLIKDFTISSINVKEGLSDLKAELVKILTSATHDSMALAGN